MGSVILRAVAAALAAVVLVPAASAAPTIAAPDRAAIRDVLNRYIPAMLLRKDVRLGWQLSGPQIRGSSTLKEWLHGGVPVYPFPARGDEVKTWTTTYVTPGDIGLDLLIQPRKGAKAMAIAFRIEMTKIRGAWKVNAFYPEATFDLKTGKVFSPQDATNNGALAMQANQRVSGRWLLLPLGLGAGVLVAVAAGLVWRRRRAQSPYREYLARQAQ
jgi:hypothetical protein